MQPVPAWTNPPSEVRPDPKVAVAFFAALFKPGDCLHFRAVPEPSDGRTPTNHHYVMDGGFSDTLAQFLEYCFVEQRAAFFLPGVVIPGRTHKDAVQSIPAVVVDFDKGNPADGLAAAEQRLGPATIIIESGGQTEHGPKLHAYWKLPSSEGADVVSVCRARESAALEYGGDPAFKQQAQVIRTPGSVHWKKGPRLVTIKALRPGATTPLSTFPSRSPKPSDNWFDFGQVKLGGPSVDDLREMQVGTEGKSGVTRWEWFNRVAGAEIADVRSGRKPPEAALAYMLGAVQRNMEHPEDWDDARVEREFNALVRLDVAERGPLVAVTPVAVQTSAEGWSIGEWRADRFNGEPPPRVWLVDGMIPAGTAGVFAAVGDAGKSMMALRLALQVATAPVVPFGPITVANPTFFGQEIIARGAAVVLTAEDDAGEVHRRLAGLDPSFARREKPLFVVPMLATGGTPAIIMNGPAGPVLTQFWSALKDELRSIPDLRLVVLDPLSAFAAGDTNDNQFGTALMMELGKLASETGAAVMLVHHFAKATVPTDLTDARSAIRGAGALVDNGRWSVVMWEADEDAAYKALKALGQPERARSAGIVYKGGLAKGNAPGAKTLRTLVRNASCGVLEDQTDAIAAAAPKRDEIDDAVLAALRDYKARYVRWNFKRSQKSLREVYHIVQQAKVNITQKAMDDCIGRLVQCGLVLEDDSPGVYIPNMDK